MRKASASRKERPLTSDELGRLGEDLFRVMCTSARLLAHPPAYDRNGWDFLVEDSGAEERETGDLATRPFPPQRLVQVKTVWEGAKEVNLRLSAAERLGKCANPSFLCILEVSEAKEAVRLHVMHMHGPLLERVLRKLREMQANDRSTEINRVQFRVLLPKVRDACPPTGDALRKAFEDAVGPDVAAYLQAKATFLEEAGVLGRKVSATFRVRADSDEAISDFLLGLRPLDVVDFQGQETRWDIKLPLVLPGIPVSVTSVPRSREVELVWRRAGAGSPVRMRMNAAVAPDPSGDPNRDHMMMNDANLTIRAHGTDLRITVKGPAVVPMSYRELRRFHALEKLLAADGQLEIQVLYRGRHVITWRPEGSLALRSPASTAALGQILDELGAVLDAGDINDVMMPSGSWLHWREQLRGFHGMLTESSSLTLSLKVRAPVEMEDDFEEREAVHISALQFDDALLAHYAICQARLTPCETPGQRQMTFRNFVVREIRMIENTDEAMAEFAREAIATTGLTTSISLWGQAAEELLPLPVLQGVTDEE